MYRKSLVFSHWKVDHVSKRKHPETKLDRAQRICNILIKIQFWKTLKDITNISDSMLRAHFTWNTSALSDQKPALIVLTGIPLCSGGSMKISVRILKLAWNWHQTMTEILHLFKNFKCLFETRLQKSSVHRAIYIEASLRISAPLMNTLSN